MEQKSSSGIRPPSKIGRPCSTLPPRPAVPPSSKPSTNHMDQNLESHGSRANEAGLRRGSDNSVVLTEDTDSFIIGDRVWVGGTKPGAIAYIGETQFAPGDWAGVVLDEPIGKNDGSVAGCRYFQCEPKRGIFSRLTRLTREPLTDPSTTMSSSPNRKTHLPTTPTYDSAVGGKGTLGKSMSPSLNTSTTSLSSSVSQKDLKIGDRVIVSSSQGSKTGVLRYMGSTEFAAGEWCGVELDEPVGKNDGSVGDKRYFECRPRYGLFAPSHKVSRSPTSKRSSCSVVQKGGGGLTSSAMRKAGSRESLVSSVSSIASSTVSSKLHGTGALAARSTSATARRPGLRTSTPARNTLQDVLKEKQQEIENLRKERDLERERVTKAANQADQAEQSAILIQQEYDKYREEMQKTVQEAEFTLTKVLQEKNALALQLEEEKRKCEDLLFRFEEESVNKDDIQKERSEQNVINTVNENRIRELEKQLAEERERVVQLERDSVKLFETEEELARLRNELSSTAQEKIEFQDLQAKCRDLEAIKATLEAVVNEKCACLERCTERIKELESNLNKQEKQDTVLKELEHNLRKDLEETKRNLQETCGAMNNMKIEYEKNTNALKEELQRNKETIEVITKQSANEKESLISEFQKIIEDKENLIRVKTEELEKESRKQLELQNSTVESVKAESSKRINELSESFNQQLNMKESTIKEISLQLDRKVSETEKLLQELSTQRDLCKKKEDELNSTLQKMEELHAKLKAAEEINARLLTQIEDYRSKAEDSAKVLQEKQKLEQDIASLIATEANSSVQLNKLSEELKLRDKELTELRTSSAVQIEQLTKQFQQQIEDKSKYIEEISSDLSKKLLVLTKLEKEVEELKAIIANKDEEIKNLLEKNTELRDALALSEETKSNLESELKVFESNVENLNQKLLLAEDKISQLSSQKEKLESDIANLIGTSTNSSEQLVKFNEDLRKKEKELDEMREKNIQTQSTLTLMEGKLNVTERELSRNTLLVQDLQSKVEEYKSQIVIENKLNAELTEKVRQYDTKEKEYLEKISEIRRIEENLKDKSNEVINLTNRLEKSQEEINKLQNQYGSLQNSQKEELQSLLEQINHLKTELSTSQEEVKILQKTKVKLEADQSANRWSIEELTERLTSEQANRSKLEAAITEKDTKLEEMESKLSELQRTNETLIMNEESANKDLTNTISAMKNTIEDLKEKLNCATKLIEGKESELSQVQKDAEAKAVQIRELSDTIASMKELQMQNTNELKNAQEALILKDSNITDLMNLKSSVEEKLKSLELKLAEENTKLDAKNNLIESMKETVKSLESSKDELRESLQRKIESKDSELESNTKRYNELEEKQKVLESTINKQNNELTVKDDVINQLKAKIKLFEDAQVEKIKADQQSKNEEIKLMHSEMDEVRKENKNLLHNKDCLQKLLKEKEEKIESLADTMKNKEKEFEKNTQNLIEKLNVVTSESAKLQEAHSRLEKEYKLLNANWIEATNELKLSRENAKNNYDAAAGDMNQRIVPIAKDIDILKLQEEKETAQSQIEFLNSVIVDMQRKNETLQCKIEVLEMGVPANEADEYSPSTLQKRAAAPRMFCDICDQFDLHETEDCPRQAQDFLEHDRVSESPKKRSTERPYCENCEIFGHDTRDCDDAETF